MDVSVIFYRFAGYAALAAIVLALVKLTGWKLVAGISWWWVVAGFVPIVLLAVLGLLFVLAWAASGGR